MDFLPLPTNLFPFWFFPWNTHSWTYFTAFVSHKELLAVDALRQIFVWKEYVYSLISLGEWPLWNPYNFSGQPLLANFQSSLFYPLSWFFLFLPHLHAWSIYIFIQPVVASVSMYLFLRRKDLSKLTSLFGGLALISCSFFANRYFWGVYLHPLIWVPAGLLLIENFVQRKNSKLLFTALMSVVMSLVILGGYPQHGVFGLMTIAAYFIFRSSVKQIPLLLAPLVISLLICSAQLLPTYELLKVSLREQNIEVVKEAVVPLKYLSTILVSDLAGSPATNNYSGDKDYTGVNVFIGIVPLVLALLAVIKIKNRETKFWTLFSVAGLLFSFVPQLGVLPAVLKIPVLSSGAPWNNLFFYQFGMVILSIFGFDYLSKSSRKPALVLSAIILLSIIALALVNRESLTAVRNAGLIAFFAVGVFLSLLLPRKITMVFLVLITAVSGAFFVNKISPWGERRFFYPAHALTTFLKNEAGFFRFWGMGGATIPTNLATHYQVFDPQGYDSLWPRWYGELLAGSVTGSMPSKVNRADVRIPENDTIYRKKLINLLGVKYFVDRLENPDDYGPNILKYPPSQFKQLKHWTDIAIYENKDVLPRAFLAENFLVTSPAESIREVLSPGNSPKTVILEKQPADLTSVSPGTVEIVKYTANNVVLKTQASGRGLLFLSDTFYPGWEAMVNNKQTPIYKANHAFRAVAVPAGESKVVFSYKPNSFQVGLSLSIIGLMILGAIFLLSTLLLKKPNQHK